MMTPIKESSTRPTLHLNVKYKTKNPNIKYITLLSKNGNWFKYKIAIRDISDEDKESPLIMECNKLSNKHFIEDKGILIDQIYTKEEKESTDQWMS